MVQRQSHRGEESSLSSLWLYIIWLCYCLMKMFFYSEEEGTRDICAQWGVCCWGDKLYPSGAWGQKGPLSALRFLLFAS